MLSTEWRLYYGTQHILYNITKVEYPNLLRSALFPPIFFQDLYEKVRISTRKEKLTASLLLTMQNTPHIMMVEDVRHLIGATGT